MPMALRDMGRRWWIRGVVKISAGDCSRVNTVSEDRYHGSRNGCYLLHRGEEFKTIRLDTPWADKERRIKVERKKGSAWLVTWHEEGDSDGQRGKAVQVSGGLGRLTEARTGKKVWKRNILLGLAPAGYLAAPDNGP
jgi:hypothetical protein